MDETQRQAWIAALRANDAGTWQQHANDDGNQCALGVLADLAAAQQPPRNRTRRHAIAYAWRHRRPRAAALAYRIIAGYWPDGC